MAEGKQHTTSAKQTTTDIIKPKGPKPNVKVVKPSIDGQNVQTPEQRKVTGQIPKTKRVTESPDDKQKTTRKSHSGGRPASTVHTESIAEHDDKQTPPSERKSNKSIGARPKTTKTSIDGQNVQTPEQRKVTGRIPKTTRVTESPDDKQKTTRKSHIGNRGRPASTVHTESIAEHDDKQTPPSERKSNKSIGARPKTTKTIEDKHTMLGDTQSTDASLQIVRKQTKQMKGKDQRQPKTKDTPSQLPVAPVGITIIAMNVDGKSAGPGTAERRKQAIQSILEKGRPDVVLLQEYKLEQIHKWKEYPIPEQYVYTGNEEASLLFDMRNIILDNIPDTEIRKIVEKLQRTPNNRLRQAFPGDFNPIPRMCMKIVKTNGAPLLEFICVSWHGRWNNGFSKENVRKTEFIYFMEFLRVVHEQYQLALLVGGDFNIDFHVIETEIRPPFVLYQYTASSRRKLNGIKDYFISTSDLLLTRIKYISLQNDTKALDPEDVLDHDPLIAHLSNKFPQQTVAQHKRLL